MSKNYTGFLETLEQESALEGLFGEKKIYTDETAKNVIKAYIAKYNHVHCEFSKDASILEKECPRYNGKVVRISGYPVMITYGKTGNPGGFALAVITKEDYSNTPVVDYLTLKSAEKYMKGQDKKDARKAKHDAKKSSATESYADEMDEEYDSVLETALDAILNNTYTIATEATTGGTKPKGHIIDKKTRDSLPDSAFGIPNKRKYPLVVKGNKEVTHELVSRAIQFFHYCNPDWKPELAKNIIKVIEQEKIPVTIHPKSQIGKYVDIPDDLVKADTENKYHTPK